MQYWSGECDSSWVQRGMSVHAAEDYVQNACGPQPVRSLPVQRQIFSTASRDACLSPKFARRGTTGFQAADAATQAEASLQQNCRFLQPACDPGQPNYLGKTYRQMLDANGMEFRTNPRKQAIIQAIDRMSDNELLQQYYTLSEQDQTHPAPDMASIRTVLKNRLQRDGEAPKYRAGQFLDWRNNTCISDPMQIVFRQWCTVPRSRKAGHNSVDGSEVPPFSWDPDWCRKNESATATGETINSDSTSTACGPWTSYCRVNKAYCHAYGHDYSGAWHQGSGGSCEENMGQQFMGMILGSFITNNILRYGFMVYDKVKAWTQSAVSTIDDWEALAYSKCGGGAGCALAVGPAVMVGTVVEAALLVVQEMSNAANYIPEYYAISQLSQGFHSGNVFDIVNGTLQLSVGLVPGMNALAAGAGEFAHHLGNQIAHFFSDPRLKRNVTVAVPDFFAPGVHLYHYHWSARAKRQYQLDGAAYGVLTTNLVEGGYGHLVATDRHGTQHVVLSRVVEEMDGRYLGDGESADPAYIRLSLLLDDQSSLEQMVHFHRSSGEVPRSTFLRSALAELPQLRSVPTVYRAEHATSMFGEGQAQQLAQEAASSPPVLAALQAAAQQTAPQCPAVQLAEGAPGVGSGNGNSSSSTGKLPADAFDSDPTVDFVRVYTRGPEGQLPICDPYALYGKHIPCIKCYDSSLNDPHGVMAPFDGVVLGKVGYGLAYAATGNHTGEQAGWVQAIERSNTRLEKMTDPSTPAPAEKPTPAPFACQDPETLACNTPMPHTSKFGSALQGSVYHGIGALCKAMGASDGSQCGKCAEQPGAKCHSTADVLVTLLSQGMMFGVFGHTLGRVGLALMLIPDIMSPSTGGWERAGMQFAAMEIQMKGINSMARSIVTSGEGEELNALGRGSARLSNAAEKINPYKALKRKLSKSAEEAGSKAEVAGAEAAEASAEAAAEDAGIAAAEGGAAMAGEASAEIAADAAMDAAAGPVGAILMVLQLTSQFLLNMYDPGGINNIMSQASIDSTGAAFSKAGGQPKEHLPSEEWGAVGIGEAQVRASSYTAHHPLYRHLKNTYMLCQKDATMKHTYHYIATGYAALLKEVGLEWGAVEGHFPPSASSAATPATRPATPPATSAATPTGTKAATPTGTKAATPTGTKAATPTGTKAATPTGTKAATPTGPGRPGGRPGGRPALDPGAPSSATAAPKRQLWYRQTWAVAVGAVVALCFLCAYFLAKKAKKK